MFTRVLLAVMLATSFGQALQPAKLGIAQANPPVQSQTVVQSGQMFQPATAMSQPPAAQSITAVPSQPVPNLMAQASQPPNPVSGQPLQPSPAATTNSASITSGWYASFTVTQISVEPGGPGFSVDTAEKLNTGCSTAGKFYFDFTQTGANQMYAAILTAQASKQKIAVFVQASLGCVGYGGIQATGMAVFSN
jgi:hypothetical protein